MRTCEGCRKPIKTRMILLSPPQHEVVLGIGVERAYHPSCYERSQQTDRAHDEAKDARAVGDERAQFHREVLERTGGGE